jgi:microcystin-dependent protein
MADAALGEIRMFSGNYEPVHWAFCDGRLLAISEYSALYSLIGIKYGGDDKTTFGLPDLRGRLPVGAGLYKGSNSTATYAIGQKGGAETVTLTPANTPSHTHSFNVTSADATTQNPVNAMLAKVTPNGATTGLYAQKPTTKQVMDSNTLDFAYGNPTTRGADPHTNMMPSLAINFIICLNGTYPVRPS